MVGVEEELGGRVGMGEGEGRGERRGGEEVDGIVGVFEEAPDGEVVWGDGHGEDGERGGVGDDVALALALWSILHGRGGGGLHEPYFFVLPPSNVSSHTHLTLSIYFIYIYKTLYLYLYVYERENGRKKMGIGRGEQSSFLSGARAPRLKFSTRCT